MSSRYDKDRQFETGLPDRSTSGTSSPASGYDDEAMHGLHLASETVLRLAARTHDAVARGDTAAAEAAHVALQKQLAMTTQLIDDMLFDNGATHTTH